MMATEDTRETCGYESCRQDNTDSAKSFGDVSYDTNISWVYSMDCKHLLPCGKCDLTSEDCPENTKRITYPVYPYVPPNPYPYVPSPYPYHPWRPYIPPWEPGTIICSYELR